jgi:hypothetical protein
MDFAILVNFVNSLNLDEAVDWALIDSGWLDAVAYTLAYRSA